jgi:hypothetical protein
MDFSSDYKLEKLTKRDSSDGLRAHTCATEKCCERTGRGPPVCLFVSAQHVFIGTSFLLELHQSSHLSLVSSTKCLSVLLYTRLAVMLFRNTDRCGW